MVSGAAGAAGAAAGVAVGVAAAGSLLGCSARSHAETTDSASEAILVKTKRSMFIIPHRACIRTCASGIKPIRTSGACEGRLQERVQTSFILEGVHSKRITRIIVCRLLPSVTLGPPVLLRDRSAHPSGGLPAKQSRMNTLQIKGNWNHIKGKLKEKYLAAYGR